ncbi:MAG: DUF4338 domain-containing protein [Dehalococcoidia bacterium]|nr:MAG: DUF4338 domain-containing protein [Dehalococcoidia bacterium]
MDKALRRRLVRSLNAARGDHSSKDSIRLAHGPQRRQRQLAERNWLDAHRAKVLPGFAEACEVDPATMKPVLVPVTAGTPDADLFRAATLLWSVPVSRGYGRRMRYLVRDDANGKIIGLFALGDPVFNLRGRDEWIGWDVAARRERISSVMDLYICGAVPPYNTLLGSKLVASLATSQEVVDRFRERYAGRRGIISGIVKPAELLVITTTSALGKSSLYNRLKLPTDPVTEFHEIGYTQGWGHFSVGDRLFMELRDHLLSEDHRYANGHQFGTGPNWRLRTIRAAMKSLGVNDAFLNHGIQRQIFATELSDTSRKQLREGIKRRRVRRPSADEIAEAGLARWVRPRYARLGIPAWSRADLERLLDGDAD